MLRSCKNHPIRGTNQANCRAVLRWHTTFWVVLFTSLPAAYAQVYPTSPNTNIVDPRFSGPQFTQPPIQQAQIQQLQRNDSSDRPLPFQIMAMPGVQEKLEVVHRRSQLIVARSNIVRTAIADPSTVDIVQYSPTEIALIGLELGSTTVTLWFDDSPNPLIYLAQTIRDPDIEDQKRIDYGKLERKLAVLFPNSMVHLIPLSGKIVVKGQARDAEEAARILQIIRGEAINQEGNLPGPQPINDDPTLDVGYDSLDQASSFIVNMLEIPGEFQVMLRVRIAELNRSQLRRKGIDFNYVFNNARHSFGYTLGGIPSTLTGIFENGEVDILLDWLASNGTAKLLSEPVMTVLSGHSASFLSGGEFAVPTIVGIGGAQGQQTSFRGFGTSVIVTPTIIDKDLIRMRIVPEFSQLNGGNAVGGIPGLDSRRVQTTIELREGQTIAIAGLLSHQASTEITRIPWLGELPFIGSRLFAAKRATQDQTELLILVTPELVRPMDADEVPPVPGHEVTPPNDWELYHAAMTEGAPDQNVYQLAPYGRGAGYGIDVGYRLFDPAPASPMYAPVPTAPYGPNGIASPNLVPQQVPPGGSSPVPMRQYQNQPQAVPLQQNPQRVPPIPNPPTSSASHYGPPRGQLGWAPSGTQAAPKRSWVRRVFGGTKNSGVVQTEYAAPVQPVEQPKPKRKLFGFGSGRAVRNE
jgi:pilus assembly protein CpaC